MARTRIKICGITDEDSAFSAVEAGADALGFVFVKSSPRYIDPDDAGDIAVALPPFVTKVALTVDQKLKTLEELMVENPYFDIMQLHGNEAEPVVRESAEIGLEIVKAVKFDPATIEAQLRKWNRISEIDAILVDGSSGGQGEAFDWQAFAELSDISDHPIILAGGLTPANVGEAIEIVQPYAVDVSSGVERSPGVKDIGLIHEFCQAVAEADAKLVQS